MPKTKKNNGKKKKPKQSIMGFKPLDSIDLHKFHSVNTKIAKKNIKNKKKDYESDDTISDSELCSITSTESENVVYIEYETDSDDISSSSNSELDDVGIPFKVEKKSVKNSISKDNSEIESYDSSDSYPDVLSEGEIIVRTCDYCSEKIEESETVNDNETIVCVHCLYWIYHNKKDREYANCLYSMDKYIKKYINSHKSPCFRDNECILCENYKNGSITKPNIQHNKKLNNILCIEDKILVL